MKLDPELHGALLLEWIFDNQHSLNTYVDTDEFMDSHDLEHADSYNLVEFLEGRGLVKGIHTFGGSSAMMTSEGIMAVRRTRAARQDPVQRVKRLRREMLIWLNLMEESNTPPCGWNEFLNEWNTRNSNEQIPTRLIEREVEYLYKKGLIEGFGTWSTTNGTLRSQLTDHGRDCVIDFGGDVSEYLNRGHGGNITNITVTDNNGNMAIGSSRFTQNQSNGADLEKVLSFASLTKQISSTLGLDDESEAELIEQADALQEEASSDSPKKGALKKFADAVMNGLTNAAPTAASGLAIAAGNEAVAAIGNIVG